MPDIEFQTKLQLIKNLSGYVSLKLGSGDPDRSGKQADLADKEPAKLKLRDLRSQANQKQQELGHLRERVVAFRERAETHRERIARLESYLDVVDVGLTHRGRNGRGAGKASGNSRVVILDDVFPHLASGFRVAEYNAYLEKWPESTVYSTANFRILRDKRPFEEVVQSYERTYPTLTGRVHPFDGSADLSDSLIYTMFVNNAEYFLNAIHAHDVPFVLTIYPGGGLQLWDEDSDRKLRRICSSPNLKKIIVTQKIVRDYLLSKSFCEEDQIEFIYGGVYQARYLMERNIPRRYYAKDKSTFDLCFVAHKYMEKGIDKGYDTFISVAEKLVKQYEDVRVHVVGSFGPSDIDVTELGDRITFYGVRKTDFFPEFYSRMDAILSPNVPFVLAPGAFDIFPIGCCIEAGTCGVPVFCTDPLDQNVAFKANEEIEIVENNENEIAETLGWYHDNPDQLRNLSSRGRIAFQRVFGVEAQMDPRIKLLESVLDGTRKAALK